MGANGKPKLCFSEDEENEMVDNEEAKMIENQNDEMVDNQTEENLDMDNGHGVGLSSNTQNHFVNQIKLVS